MTRNNFMCDGTFNGNMLVVGQARCGKTSFVQKLGKNKMFGSIESVDWISKIELSAAREHQIRESFSHAFVEFHYPNDVGEFETILELLKDNKSDVNININDTEADDLGIGEKDIFDRLIVMDDVSGLADKSNEFCSFLTVSRKYKYSCIYIFHIVFPQLRNWQMIISQTKIFNIFPSAVQLGNLSKLLTNNCDRETLKYIPKRELWINRLYFEIANRKDYSCLRIGCRKSGPSKYRTEADNNVRQACFFSQKKKDRVFGRFASHNLEPDYRDSLIFKIELSDKNSDICLTTNYYQKVTVTYKSKTITEVMTEEISKEKVKKMNQMLKDAVIEMEQKPENDHDFSFLEEPNQEQESVMAKHLKRRIKPYTSSRIKMRHFLSNISYTDVKSEDFADNNFTFDTITLLTKNITPFSLE